MANTVWEVGGGEDGVGGGLGWGGGAENVVLSSDCATNDYTDEITRRDL